MDEPRFLAIVGPTSSGKTALSLAVGRLLHAEVISMDSRQIYRGMDIGTGKATLRERARLPHHGLDIREPTERYSAGQFARDARRWVEQIRSRGRIPLLVGGTGFFLRALSEPMFSEPELDRDRLEKLRSYLKGLPIQELRRFRQALDPGNAGEGEDRQRVTRRLEMALLTGQPLSWWHGAAIPDAGPLPRMVALVDLPRDLLYDRINRRVDDMIRDGLVEEVAALLQAGFGPEDPGMTGAGYREIVSYLRGEWGLEEAAERIRRAHRRYARRQTTWYRHQLTQDALVADGTRPREEVASELVEAWRRRGGAWGNRVEISKEKA